ncbi:MAG: YkgJ family cysteine cluster protein [Desulfobacterales bacterium]|nr:YkgJ family cysteine cluster protein [Desulfobacterales bacterium]
MFRISIFVFRISRLVRVRVSMVQANHIIPEREEAPRTHCIRCGTCCMKGGPTLHEEDAILFTKGILKRSDVYTLRKGEVVRNIDDTLLVLEQEVIKIKGQGEAWSCMFYDDDQGACRIYDHRPLECRALKCWDLRGFKEVMERPCLQRRDLIKRDDGILEIISAHEQRCAYETLESAVSGLRGPDSDKAVENILALLQYDHYMRPLLTEKLKVDPNAMDFFFGRPLTTTIRMFGLCVKQEGDTFLLVPVESHTS